MAQRVYFHIGLPKSGTTFLQTTMWHNRRHLAAQGFLYPGTKRMDHYHASQEVRGAPASRVGEGAGSWQRLVAELAAWEGTGLVSHEFFSLATARQATAAVEALAPAEVHVVVTARDYVRQFPAIWQEALKMNSDLSLDAFMEKALAHDLHGAWGWKSQDLPKILRRWSKAVPARRVHVVTLPPAGAPRDLLWERWRTVLGIDDSAFDRDLAFANQSMGAAQAALMRRVKPYLSGPLRDGAVRHRWLRQYFGHEVLGAQHGDRFGLRPEHAARLREHSLEAVAAIAKRRYKVIGDLADLVPPEVTESLPHPDDCTESEVLDVAAQAIEQMIRDVRELTKERSAWREQAEAVPPRVGAARRLTRRVRGLVRR